MRVICLLSSCTSLLRIYEITKVGSPHNFIKVTLLFLLFLVYVSVNVFSAKVLRILFLCLLPGDWTAISSGHTSHMKDWPQDKACIVFLYSIVPARRSRIQQPLALQGHHYILRA